MSKKEVKKEEEPKKVDTTKKSNEKKAVKTSNQKKEVTPKEKVTSNKKEEKKVEEKVEEKVKKIKKPVNEKVIIFSIIGAILLVAFGIFGYFFYETSMKPVATYDGGKVTKSEYTIYYKTFQPMLSYYGYPDSIIPQQIANKAALDEIIVKEAKADGVTISDDRKKEIDDQFADKDQISQLEEQGINPDQMKKLYYADALISAYIDKKVEEANDDEVLAYIKENNENPDLTGYETSHILLKTTNDSGTALSDEEKANKKSQAEDILKRAQAGEDFASLASELSEDTATKDNGGNYNVYMDGQTDESYSNAVKSMKVGDIVLVESQYGYHIIKLNNIVENGRVKNDADREDYVNEQINNISAEKNFKVNDDNLAKVVEQINGKSTSTDNTTTTDSTNTTTNDTTTNTTTGE